MLTKKDPRIDAYIEKAADFARPILTHIRNLVHKASPQITETIKWGMPHFEYKGILCHMAAFKAHCALGFFKGALLDDPQNHLSRTEGMGHFGRIGSINDLPEDGILIAYIENAIRINDEGLKLPRKKPGPENRIIEIPDFIQEAINASARTKKVFEKFSYSHRKEYVQWISEAKTEATRQKRLSQALQWIAEGKSRNWK